MAQDGGALTNDEGGQIAGSASGVAQTGGTLTNAGYIVGYQAGVSEAGGTLDNSGAITSSDGYGVSETSGTLNNDSGGSLDGVMGLFKSGGTVTNAGAIGSYDAGVYQSGGTLTNDNGGIITRVVNIVIAEGLAAESYLDCGNRTAFNNGGAFLQAYPNFTPKHWHQTCAPLMLEGPQLRHAKAAVLRRARDLGHRLTDDSNLHIVAESKRIDPVA